MSEPIVYIDRSEIREGKLEQLRPAMAELAEFVEAHEPQLLSYGFFIDEQASRMTVVAIHPDAASIEFHMDVAGERFKRFAELIDLRAIEVYGAPSEKILQQLRHKAASLGDGGSVTVQRLHAGFTRLGAHASDVASSPGSSG